MVGYVEGIGHAGATGWKKIILVKGRDDTPEFLWSNEARWLWKRRHSTALADGIIRRIVGQPQRLR